MMIAVFWLLALALFAVATRVGRHFGVIPIVSQLLLASIGLPLLMLLWMPMPQVSPISPPTPIFPLTLTAVSPTLRRVPMLKPNRPTLSVLGRLIVRLLMVCPRPSKTPRRRAS